VCLTPRMELQDGPAGGSQKLCGGSSALLPPLRADLRGLVVSRGLLGSGGGATGVCVGDDSLVSPQN
jgi:hypothetical protein